MPAVIRPECEEIPLSQPDQSSRGTGSSNPVPSSGESRELRYRIREMCPGGVGLSGPALRAVRIEFSSPLNTEGVVVLGERGLGGDRSGQVFELCPLYH